MIIEIFEEVIEGFLELALIDDITSYKLDKEPVAFVHKLNMLILICITLFCTVLNEKYREIVYF